MRLNGSSFPGYLVAGQPATDMETISERDLVSLRSVNILGPLPREDPDLNREIISMLIRKKTRVKHEIKGFRQRRGAVVKTSSLLRTSFRNPSCFGNCYAT
jgi:hypothetical protein